ncbi:two component transcriptional regulator, LuxR family protein [Roseobacter sp. AzwK-3b]|uniref:LuxR C-terminal-related transcriptional regulator n=1 Tax=Roseobacter sp. AzwK-3b TaxID=351016 RepID=UPI000156948F|nr:response regulator transcription factor [Roseobacter sp. AzwK-3b]EDM72121.1 two component transcriptional regulator, LuxR family protein [Roseobacter sp. AzwK-3b]
MTDHSVLIIEDRADIVARLSDAINVTEGLTLVGCASTLDQGLNLLFDLKPRILLVDIGLPDGSGVEAVHACAAADWLVDAVVVSIFGDEARVLEAIQAGAKGYLLKGADLGQIGTDILSVLDGGSPISPGIARHLLAVVKDGGTGSVEPGLSPLTEREAEILQAVARGYKRHEIAQHLGISAGTVGNHITSIYRKLEVSTNMEAVARASKKGFL